MNVWHSRPRLCRARKLIPPSSQPSMAKTSALTSEHLKNLMTLSLHRRRVLKRAPRPSKGFVLPAALPEILTGCRTGLVLALITMVTSEMIARQSGAGNILFNALDMGQYDTVYAMIIIIGAMGIGLDAAFERLRGRLVKWSEPGFDVPLSFA